MAATINVSDLITEFGTYLAQNQKDIIKKLTQPLVTTQFMTSVMSTSLEWRSALSSIDSVVQGFQKGFTPKGNATFTPLSIPQRRHKIDLTFYPDEVVESWLGFLVDETKTRADWPITKYIIEELIIPKVNSDRELYELGKGNYEAPVEGVAQTVGKAMDGFCTLIEDEFDSGTSSMNFFTDADTYPGVPTSSNIVDWMEAFVDWIDVLYQGIEMPIFLSNSWYKIYKRKYRDLYGANMDYNPANADKVDFSLNRLQPLPSMSGKNTIFTTPKANFIRLRNANDGADHIEIEKNRRAIEVMGDWYESVGFAVAEGVFAYTPEDSSVSGS